MQGEKIDVINWSEDPKEFIAAALSPSKVLAVAINEQDQSAKIVVPDHQLSLAIGKEGQNARLSAKLTGWRIDIKSETQARETNFLGEEQLINEESEEQRMLRMYQEAFADLEEPKEPPPKEEPPPKPEEEEEELEELEEVENEKCEQEFAE